MTNDTPDFIPDQTCPASWNTITNYFFEWEIVFDSVKAAIFTHYLHQKHAILALSSSLYSEASVKWMESNWNFHYVAITVFMWHFNQNIHFRFLFNQSKCSSNDHNFTFIFIYMKQWAQKKPPFYYRMLLIDDDDDAFNLGNTLDLKKSSQFV